jgi:DNA-directed RNA polymerase omega subunit
MTTAAAANAAVSTSADPIASPVLQSTFHLVVVASQRAKQLIAGARPRVEIGDHRHTRVAVMEVNAGLVSWTVTEKPPSLIEPEEPLTARKR